MADSYQFWGNDSQFSATGDDLLATALTELEQRMFRKLLMNPGDDVFNPLEGIGIGRYIGKPLTPERYAALQSGVLKVVMVERDVQKLPLPTINYQVSDRANTFLSVSISFIYAPMGQPRTITAP